MKHSECFLLEGAETRQHSDHRNRHCAINGGPTESWATHHACMKQTRCPSSVAKSPLWSDLFPRLDSTARKKKEGREIKTQLTSQIWLGTSRSGATRVNQFKVGLTTSLTVSLSLYFIKSCKRGQQQKTKPWWKVRQNNSRNRFSRRKKKYKQPFPWKRVLIYAVLLDDCAQGDSNIRALANKQQIFFLFKSGIELKVFDLFFNKTMIPFNFFKTVEPILY